MNRVLVCHAIACFAYIAAVASAEPLKLESATGSKLVLAEGLELRARGRRFFSRSLLPSGDKVSQLIMQGVWEYPDEGRRIGSCRGLHWHLGAG